MIATTLNRTNPGKHLIKDSKSCYCLHLQSDKGDDRASDIEIEHS